MGYRHHKPNCRCRPVRDDRGRGSACAKAVDASTSRGVGISVTARTPNACGWSGAGRRRGGRPNGARTRRSKPSMPRHERARRQRAASSPQPPKTPEVAAARGHAAKIFSPTPICDRPGCHEPPLKSGRNQALLLPACRQAVRRVRRSRTQVADYAALSMAGVLREQEYQAARVRRRTEPHDTASATPATGAAIRDQGARRAGRPVVSLARQAP